MKNCKIIYCFKSKKNWIAIKMQKKIYDIKKPILILIFWNNSINLIINIFRLNNFFKKLIIEKFRFLQNQ